MRWPARTPLAWSNLVHSKPKLLGALAGITFAVALMFMELGFQNALLDGMVQLAERLDGDLILVSRTTYSIGFKDPFSRRRLQEVRRFAEVERVSPVYVESTFGSWRHPGTGVRWPIRVVAFRLDDGVFLDPAVARRLEALRAPDTALFDARGKWWLYGGAVRPQWRPFEALAGNAGPTVGTVGELSGHAIRVVGTFDMGADLANDGTLLMSEENYRRVFGAGRPVPPDLLVDLGLIKVRPNVRADSARLRELRDAIDAALPDSVVACVKGDLIARERKFWEVNTPVGLIFFIGLVMGFIVGTVICYQILSSGISTYLREYATLLAMGYDRGFLVRVVIQQAIYLGVMGFVCGLGVASVIYAVVAWYTRMPFVFVPGRVASIFAATMAMCVASACFAARRLYRAAPAELF